MARSGSTTTVPRGLGTLLEEHDYISVAEARKLRSTVRDGGVRVTLNGAESASTSSRASVHGWAWTYSGITASEAQEIARRAHRPRGVSWTVEPIAS